MKYNKLGSCSQPENFERRFQLKLRILLPAYLRDPQEDHDLL